MLRIGRPNHQSTSPSASGQGTTMRLGAYNNLAPTTWNVYVPAPEAADVSTRTANLATALTTSVTPFVPGG